jgi:hypothetical protein
MDSRTHHLDFIVYSCPEDPEGNGPLFSAGAFLHQMELVIIMRDGTLPEGIVFRRRENKGDDWLYYRGCLYQRVGGKMTGLYLQPSKKKGAGNAQLREFCYPSCREIDG